MIEAVCAGNIEDVTNTGQEWRSGATIQWENAMRITIVCKPVLFITYRQSVCSLIDKLLQPAGTERHCFGEIYCRLVKRSAHYLAN